MELRFADLFAGIGGMRLGVEQACRALGYKARCVFTSEIKPHALTVLQQNFPGESIAGDITKIEAEKIPDFDILCAGFPCQAFSAAGTRKGFADTRGTLFFDVERVLRAKRPRGFILENVEGLTNHDGGRTLATILAHLRSAGYLISYRVLDSKDFGVAQARRRIYIVGTQRETVDLTGFPVRRATLSEVLSSGLPTLQSRFTELLLAQYDVKDLYGKSIKDKRGGANNIHSWDVGVKGETTAEERALLNKMLTERRKKKWAEEYGIAWMDGMPLTRDMIHSFYPKRDLDALLHRLVKKGYIVMEHPKQRIVEVDAHGRKTVLRQQDPSLPLGYNIVTGKLSFEINKILDPTSIAPTLVATDIGRLAVVDGNGLRRLTLREGLRLFGYPEEYKFEVDEREGYDLLGNTVVVPVIKAVSERLISNM